MVIKRVVIENFGNISYKEYIPNNKVAFLDGPNGWGKSTTIRAIVWGLTGNNSSDSLIKDGENMARVSLEIEGPVGTTVFSRSIQRGKTAKCSVNGKNNVAIKVFDATLLDETGIKASTIKLTTMQELVSSMKPEELMAFLLEMVPDTKSLNDLMGMVSELTPDMVALLNDYAEAMDLDPLESTDSQKLILEIYNAFFAEKSSCNKSIQEKKKQVDPSIELPPARSLVEIREEISNISVIEASESAVKEAHQLYKASLASRETALNKVKDAEEELRSLPIVSKPDESVRTRLLDELAEQEEEIKFANKNLFVFENNISRFQSALKTLETPICPLSDKLCCTTDKTAVRQELLDAIEENSCQKQSIEHQITSMQEQVNSLKKKLEKESKDELAYKQRMSAIQKVEDLKKMVPPIPDKPTTVVSSEDFSERKIQLRKEEAYALGFEKNNILTKEIENLEKRFEALQKICVAFAPKGEVLTKVQEAYVSYFNSVLSERTKLFDKHVEARLICENGVVFQMKFNSEFHNFEECSHGEQVYGLFLLLDLFNSLFGTRILFLDDLNHLDSKSFESLIKVVMKPEVVDCYDHIFLLTASNTDADAIVDGLFSASKIDTLI